LLVDKPRGPTSFDVVARVRAALDTRQVGHAGTLDPAATGLLVVLVGKYTRLSQYLTRADKAYEAVIQFGTRTNTDDAEGEVVEEGDPSALQVAEVVAALRTLDGPQEQTPPAFAAISVGGERLYAKARRGETVEVPPRSIVVHELSLRSFGDARAAVSVRCSKGTYVRAIARDLGAAVGVPAHLAELRRTSSGGYHVDDALPLDELTPEAAAAALKSGPAALRGVRLVEIDVDAAASLRHGRTVPTRAALADDDVAVAHLGDELVGIVRVAAGQLKPVRALA
jgi:tRNA pseudouridine55 synthase